MLPKITAENLFLEVYFSENVRNNILGIPRFTIQLLDKKFKDIFLKNKVRRPKMQDEIYKLELPFGKLRKQVIYWKLDRKGRIDGRSAMDYFI